MHNRISKDNPEWNDGSAKPDVQKTTGMLEMDAITILCQQTALIQNMITNLFCNMSLGQKQAQVNMVYQPQAWCKVC